MRSQAPSEKNELINLPFIKNIYGYINNLIPAKKNRDYYHFLHFDNSTNKLFLSYKLFYCPTFATSTTFSIFLTVVKKLCNPYYSEWASIFLQISSVNSEHFALPPRSPVR